MAWQFNSDGIGGAINRGLKDAEESILKEKERLRQQALDDLAGADKYKKRKVDASGNTIGYESDEDARAKAIDFVRKRLPGYTKPAPATTIKPYQQVMQEQGISPVTGDPSVPQGPSPLLENPNKTKLEQAAADRELDMSKGVMASEEADKSRQHEIAKAVATEKVKSAASALADRAKPNLSYKEEVGDAVPTGQLDAQGNPIKVQPVNQGVSFEEASVTGEAPPKQMGVDPSMVNSTMPPPIEVPAEEVDPLNVDDYTLRRLVDQVTSPTTTKDGATPAGAWSDSLDPELQKRLGVQGQSIFLPFSFIARGIQGQQGERTQADKSIGAETYDAIAELESGVPYSVVARKLSEAWGGKIPPQVASELRSARAAIAGEGQRKVVNQAREESRNDKLVEKQDRALERFEEKYNNTGLLAAAGPLARLEEITGVLSGRVDKKLLPGTGTNLARALPFIGDDIAQAVAKGYGGEEVSQLIQALANVNIKNASGTAVSKHEMGRKAVEFGMSAFGNEKDVARGVKLMVEGIVESANSVKAAFPDEVRQQYVANKGKLPEIIFGQEAEKRGQKYTVNQKDGETPAASRNRIESAKKLKIGQGPGQTGLKDTMAIIDSAPRVGDIVDGYKYKGGNPAEQSNWEKAK